jgi:hypothetical protein
VAVPPASITGRDRELAVARRFVADTAQGPAALVFEGAAGIGKTAIWAEAVRTARTKGDALVVVVLYGGSGNASLVAQVNALAQSAAGRV